MQDDSEHVGKSQYIRDIIGPKWVNLIKKYTPQIRIEIVLQFYALLYKIQLKWGLGLTQSNKVEDATQASIVY